MKVKAIISFNAFGIMAETGQEFEIGDKEKRLDLEKLGWIEPLEYEVTEDFGAKRATKRAKE